MSAARVLLRAKSGPRIGLGHLMRTRAVAEEIAARGGVPLFAVDDEASAELVRNEGFEACCVEERPEWARERASGAWIDGFGVDWSTDLRELLRSETPSYLVENRSRSRIG